MTKTRQAKPRLGKLKLAVLGPASITLDSRPIFFTRRKSLALLTFLALEPSEHPREKLADFLWPNSRESRSSLRTALAEIKDKLGARLVAGRDCIALNRYNLELDVDQAKKPIGDLIQVTELEFSLKLFRGDLLEGVALPDAPEFEDWLREEREALKGRWDDHLERLANVHFQSGKFSTALNYAQKRLRLEPLNERAHRQVVEIYLASGNRSSALEAFNACRNILKLELGVEPDIQTQRLLGWMGQPSPPMQLHTIAPPTSKTDLVGRDREWALMERAWEAGKVIIVHGSPGVGKSRLIEEFASSRGKYVHSSGRPGDTLVSYGTHARFFRQLMDSFELSEIPSWIQTELSRIVPEIGLRPSPLASESDKLCLFEAQAEILKLFFAKGCAVVVADDVQYFDPASLESTFYSLFKFLPTNPGLPRYLLSYRTEELSDNARVLIQQGVESGFIVLIEVKPLEPSEVSKLFSILEILN